MTELSTTIGLANLGNTCFLNAVLQALRLSAPLGNMFIMTDITLREKSEKHLLLQAFQVLLHDFWRVTLPPGSKPTLAPRGFHNALLKTIRAADEDWHVHGQQGDAAETIQYILSSLHDAMYAHVTMNVLGKPLYKEEVAHVKAIDAWGSFFCKEYSPIIEHYNGQTQTSVVCSQCAAVSTRYEPWLMLKVPIPSVASVAKEPGVAATLTDCMNQGFADERIDDYQCDGCKAKGTATLQHRISKLPDVIILTFKRFTNSMAKVNGIVTWPMDAFDFRPWMAFQGDPFNKIYTPPLYETTALIEHQGSFHGGHYRMYAKQPSETDPSKQIWNEYDDNSVREVSGNPGATGTATGTAYGGDSVERCTAYIAFLTRKNLVEPMNIAFGARVRILRQKQLAASAAAVAAAPAAEA